MALDGLVLTAIARELADALVGGRIDRVTQPTADDVLLTIRAGHANLKLLLSANKSYPRAHLTTRFRAPNPPSPPMFCMLMRKHLEGGRIACVTQWRRERMLFLDIEARDEFGDKVVRRIVVEIMGKHSNVILLDRPDGQIIDAISHVSRAVNRHREVLPGRSYVYPPQQDKIDPLTESSRGFRARREARPEDALGAFALQTYLGISPFFARELDYEATRRKAPDAEAEWLIFGDLLQRAKEAKEPVTVRDTSGRGAAFYLFLPEHVKGVVDRFPTMNECVDAFYSERALSDIARAKAGSFLRVARAERERAALRARRFQELLEAADDAEAWRIAAELLTAYLHQVPRGASEVYLPNFYDGERQLRIELNPAKGPLENANAYYRRYNKYKRGLSVTAEQLQLAKQDTVYLDTVIHELETCRVEDIPGIEEELRAAGLLKTQTKKKQEAGRGARDKHAKPHPLTFSASDGTAIWVGRNNTENDAITFRHARKTHLWLHVKDAPGSHVVIASDQPADLTVREAALLAVHFSRERESSKAQVDVVPVGHLWKPNGAKPGFVLFEGQQTIAVTRDEEALARLLGNTGTDGQGRRSRSG